MNSLLILCNAFAATAIVDAKSSYILVEDGERERMATCNSATEWYISTLIT